MQTLVPGPVNKNLLSWDIWVLKIKVHGDFGFRN